MAYRIGVVNNHKFLAMYQTQAASLHKVCLPDRQGGQGGSDYGNNASITSNTLLIFIKISSLENRLVLIFI